MSAWVHRSEPMPEMLAANFDLQPVAAKTGATTSVAVAEVRAWCVGLPRCISTHGSSPHDLHSQSNWAPYKNNLVIVMVRG